MKISCFTSMLQECQYSLSFILFVEILMSAAGYYPFLFKQGSQKLARLAAKNREKQGDKSTNLDFCLYFVHHRHFFYHF